MKHFAFPPRTIMFTPVLLVALLFHGGAILAQTAKTLPASAPELTAVQKLALTAVFEEFNKAQADFKAFSDEFAAQHPGWRFDIQRGPVPLTASETGKDLSSSRPAVKAGQLEKAAGNHDSLRPD